MCSAFLFTVTTQCHLSQGGCSAGEDVSQNTSCCHIDTFGIYTGMRRKGKEKSGQGLIRTNCVSLLSVGVYKGMLKKKKEMALAFIPLSFLLCPSQQLEAAHQHCNLLLMELNLCTHISAVPLFLPLCKECRETYRRYDFKSQHLPGLCQWQHSCAEEALKSSFEDPLPSLSI